MIARLRQTALPSDLDDHPIIAQVDSFLKDHGEELLLLGESFIYFQGEEEGIPQDKGIPLLYIPEEFRGVLWQMAHSSLHAGHPGPNQTMRNIASIGGWWPLTMLKDCTKWGLACPPSAVV